MRSRTSRRFLATAAGLSMDRLIGEPPAAVHPVAGFGLIMERVERMVWADRRSNGAVYALSGAVTGAVTGLATGSTSVCAWAAVAGRELRRVASRVGGLLETGDLAAARAELPALAGRDPSDLDSSGIAAAVIESLAENSVDAVIAPAFWAAVAGAPGACVYRAVNTMDSMVGHRNERHSNFGWAAARLDDMANYVPARIFAALLAVLHPHRAREIVAVVRRDSPAHPSPNAGVAEAAMAAALGRRLGGPLRYGSATEDRPRLGDGPRPNPADIPAAVRIADRIEQAAVMILVLISLLIQIRKQKSQQP